MNGMFLFAPDSGDKTIHVLYFIVIFTLLFVPALIYIKARKNYVTQKNFSGEWNQDSLGKRLRQARQILGHIQEQSARRMYCDESNLRYIELGNRIPKLNISQKTELNIWLGEKKMELIPFNTRFQSK